MGLPVFKTGGAALGAARWVRLPRVPASAQEIPSSIKKPATDRQPPADGPPTAKRRARVEPGSRPPARHDRRRRAGRRGSRGRSPSERSRLAAGDARAVAGRARGRRSCDASRGSPAPTSSAVINATGVIVHTNLGRAPWPDLAASPRPPSATSYLLLELDRATGRRGARLPSAEEHLVALTGAEDALRHEQQRRRRGPRGRPGRARWRGRRVARRAGRDRRRRAHPRHRPPGRGQADRGRDHQPDAGGGLRGATRGRSGKGGPARPSRRTSRCPASPRCPIRPRSRPSPIATAPSSSTTWVRARCCDTAATG